MANYYLVSRISEEYHKKHIDLVNMVEGEPFIPHLNNPYNLEHDKLSNDVFEIDYKAMKESDFGLVSLPIGEDCSSEIGWYAGNGKPIYCIIQSMEEYENLKSIWMVKGFLTECIVVNDYDLYKFIKETDLILNNKLRFEILDTGKKIDFNEYIEYPLKKWVDLEFTIKFKNELIKKIPSHIKKYIPSLKLHRLAHVRFDNDSLKAIYLNFVPGEFEEPEHVMPSSVQLKFEYVSDDFVLKNIYFINRREYSVDSDGGYHNYEYRYDLDMNLVAKYRHNQFGYEPIMNEEGTEFLMGEQYEKNNKKLNTKVGYIVSSAGTDEFSDKLEFLIKKGMVKNNLKGNKTCSHFWKSTDKNVIYLGISKYWVE